MLKTLEYPSLQTTQPVVLKTEETCVEVVTKDVTSPRVCVRGDICLHVTEEATREPVVGHYSLDIQGMQEPLFVLWHAEGEVSSPRKFSTDITFDLHEAKAGEVRTHVVQVQVMEQNGQHCISCSVFIQIVVIEDHLMELLQRINRASIV